jgi:sugar/nucleoside kinase (ribokinase family)
VKKVQLQLTVMKFVESDIKKNLKIIDLTGAGDLFAAGFLHGYINKLSVKECLEKGTEMSSRVIQQLVQDFKLNFFFF